MVVVHTIECMQWLFVSAVVLILVLVYRLVAALVAVVDCNISMSIKNVVGISILRSISSDIISINVGCSISTTISINNFMELVFRH